MNKMKNIFEAQDQLAVMANRIIKRLNWIQTLEIMKMSEPDFNQLSNICANWSPNFDSLSEEDQESVMLKIYNRIKHSSEINDRSTLFNKVKDYISSNGNIIRSADDFMSKLYPNK